LLIPLLAALALSSPQGDPAARASAQRGLDSLVRSAVAWQDQNNCYGCHVQAVTLEAITVARSHGYTVDAKLEKKILHGMLDGSGGQHGPSGFSVGGDAHHLIETSTSFGGSALAHWDERVSASLQKELVQTAEKLITMQNPDGSVRTGDQRRPVCAGEMQSTTQALVTWRQAQARTADTRWLVPIRRAEAWLTGQAKRFSDERPEDLQDVAHAIIGLSAAGRGAGDKLVGLLARSIERSQSDDGGFAFARGEPSSAYMTGQALYALRLAGRADDDRAVQRGTKWLMQHQDTDGGWGGGGFAKAESMWAVLGLVAMDVLSVDVAGLDDGGRVDGIVKITAVAADNSGAKPTGVKLFVDDVEVAAAKGATLSATIDAAKLTDGAHLIDVVAVNDAGAESRRRFLVHAGDSWLADVGTRFDGGLTQLSFRELMPQAKGRVVEVRVHAAENGGKGAEVAKIVVPAVEGPMSIPWDGAGAKGTRFVGVVRLLDENGRVRDVEEVLFTHESYEAQRAKYAEVQGSIGMEGGGLSANTEVELVDDHGNVVQKVATTRSGQYRFQNVDGGKYKVRVKKQGFKAWEADVAAEAAKETAAPAAALAH
jgi:hypothetical protein